MEKTRVIFRKFKDQGDVVALFPDEPFNERGGVMSYQHVGQHGEADYAYVVRISHPTTPKEHRALRQELESIGYKLDVRVRK